MGGGAYGAAGGAYAGCKHGREGGMMCISYIDTARHFPEGTGQPVVICTARAEAQYARLPSLAAIAMHSKLQMGKQEAASATASLKARSVASPQQARCIPAHLRRRRAIGRCCCAISPRRRRHVGGRHRGRHARRRSRAAGMHGRRPHCRPCCRAHSRCSCWWRIAGSGGCWRRIGWWRRRW